MRRDGIALLPFPLHDIPDDIVEEEAREATHELAERRVIRIGRDAWAATNKAQSSFDGWLAVGRALLIGREVALRSTGANAPMGRPYCAAFSQWVKAHGFTGMQKSVRSVAVELAERADQITAWRDSLPARQRKRLDSPIVSDATLACCYRAEHVAARDLKWEAQMAWARFVACARALPPELARPLWEAARAQAAAALAR